MSALPLYFAWMLVVPSVHKDFPVLTPQDVPILSQSESACRNVAKELNGHHFTIDFMVMKYQRYDCVKVTVHAAALRKEGFSDAEIEQFAKEKQNAE